MLHPPRSGVPPWRDRPEEVRPEGPAPAPDDAGVRPSAFTVHGRVGDIDDILRPSAPCHGKKATPIEAVTRITSCLAGAASSRPLYVQQGTAQGPGLVGVVEHQEELLATVTEHPHHRSGACPVFAAHIAEQADHRLCPRWSLTRLKWSRSISSIPIWVPALLISTASQASPARPTSDG